MEPVFTGKFIEVKASYCSSPRTEEMFDMTKSGVLGNGKPANLNKPNTSRKDIKSQLQFKGIVMFCGSGGRLLIAVYVCKLDFEWEEERFQSSLSQTDAAKRARILRFLNKKDAWRSLLADMLLRKVLCERFYLREDDLVFGTNRYGKPYLLGNKDVFFNLTHSGDWVGCIAGGSPVGIDIEQIRPIDLAMALNCFSTNEHSALMAAPETDRLGFFYVLWTLKESYMKAVGKGLSLPLQSFTVPTGGGTPLIPVNGPEAGYFCKTYTLEEGYKMAVCSRGNLFPDQPKVIDAKLLVCGNQEWG